MGPVSFTPELVIALQKVFVYATKLPILVCTHSSQMMLPFLPKALALTDLRVLVKDACDIGHHFIANWHLFRILFAATTFYPVDLFWDGHAQPKIGSSANFYWHFATLFNIFGAKYKRLLSSKKIKILYEIYLAFNVSDLWLSSCEYLSLCWNS